jgi:hypothetical protein
MKSDECRRKRSNMSHWQRKKRKPQILILARVPIIKSAVTITVATPTDPSNRKPMYDPKPTEKRKIRLAPMSYEVNKPRKIYDFWFWDSSAHGTV